MLTDTFSFSNRQYDRVIKDSPLDISSLQAQKRIDWESNTEKPTEAKQVTETGELG